MLRSTKVFTNTEYRIVLKFAFYQTNNDYDSIYN